MSSILRKNRLLFPRFQLGLVGVNLLALLLALVILWIQFERVFSDLGIMSGFAGGQGDYYQKYLSYQVGRLREALLLAFALSSAICVLLTVLLSHRFVGPLVNLRRFFEAIVSGERPLPKLKFRRNDYLDDLPPLINRALDSLERGTSTSVTAKDAEER